MSRAVDTRQVEHRQQTDHGLAEVERLGNQSIADIVVQRDEAAHQQKALQEQPGQAGIAEVQAVALQQSLRAQRSRTEVPRFRQKAPEQQGRQQRQPAHQSQHAMPGQVVHQHAAQQASAHAADGVAANVQPHCQAQMVGMDLLAQVGHGHCSHAAERQADQCAHQQNAMPAGRQRTTDGEHRGSEQGGDQHLLAADGIGDRPGDQQADGQGQRRERKDQAALRCVDAECLRQHGHHRLHAVEQGEGGEAAGEQRQGGAREARGAFLCMADGRARRRYLC